MGRSTLLLVSGFLIIFGIIQRSVQNRQQIIEKRAPQYFYQEQSRNVAGGMLEIALGNLNNGLNYLTPHTIDDIEIDMLGGTGTINIDSTSHFNSRLFVTITGEMERPDSTKAITEINATFNRNPFSIYAYFTDSENTGIAFGSDDVLNGPVHTNDTFLFRGDPVFNGPITSPNMWEDDTYDDSSEPEFNGEADFQARNVELPTEAPKVTELADQGGLKFNDEIFLEFLSGNGNGNNEAQVEVYSTQRKCTFKLGSTCVIHEYENQSIGTYKLSEFNGVISSSQNIHMKGTVDGQVTVHSEKDVRIAGDIVYENRNYNDEAQAISDDRLGIISEKNTIVNNDAHMDQGQRHLSIDASILTLGKSFSVEGYYFTADDLEKWYNTSLQTFIPNEHLRNRFRNIYAHRGKLNILGGLIQKERGPVGTGNKSGVHSGYGKNYVYDTRFLRNSTPGFPRKKMFEIENWRETTRVEPLN